MFAISARNRSRLFLFEHEPDTRIVRVIVDLDNAHPFPVELCRAADDDSEPRLFGPQHFDGKTEVSE
jgi:hypothetical protein